MINFFKTLFLFTVLYSVCVFHAVAQQPVAGYALQANTGLGASLNASIAGTSGTTTAFYVLISNFVGGSIPSNVVQLNTVPGTLNSTNFVSFIWLPVPGVTSYDLLKLTSSALPSGTATVVLRSALSSTTTSTTDQGGSLSSYTLAAVPVGGVANITLNSFGHKSPLIAFDGANGLNPGQALNGKVLASRNANRSFTDATATGVTITATSMVGGLYFHAPTGAVNDATDTAANLIAALPACYVNSTSTAGLNVGATFSFSLYNNSGGANTITVTAGTGVTLVGTMTVAQNQVRNFIGLVTNCTTPAITLYSQGAASTF